MDIPAWSCLVRKRMITFNFEQSVSLQVVTKREPRYTKSGAVVQNGGGTKNRDIQYIL